MKTNNFSSALVCGFGVSVLSTVPGIKSFSCCLLIPLAGAVSIYLHHKINKIPVPFEMKDAVLLGFLTGIIASVFSTFFDLLITFITHSNDFIDALPKTESLLRQYNFDSIIDQTFGILKQMAVQIQTNGFSVLYAGAILFSNVIVDSIFGMIGGIIGLSFFKRRTRI
jgi:hypothetical protein